MLSRVFTKNAFRGSLALSRMTKPGNYVCFCGCSDANHMSNMVSLQKRNFQGHLYLDSSANLVPQTYKKDEQVSLWKEIRDKNSKALVLKNNDEITNYVLSVVKNYFRTTKKASVTIDSKFTDHGLDSLDVIELVIQIEDELGYLIDAENLELFSKPKHFINFISQMEAYKTEHHRLPHENIHADLSLKKYFPLPNVGH